MSRKPFINALVRRLLRDDLPPEDRLKVGELIEQLQQAEAKEKAGAMTPAQSDIETTTTGGVGVVKA